jgi:hypothetical protein
LIVVLAVELASITVMLVPIGKARAALVGMRSVTGVAPAVTLATVALLSLETRVLEAVIGK